MDNGQRGGSRKGAGSHPLGGKGSGEYRESVQVRETVNGTTFKVNLSVLPSQKELLGLIGHGNVSEGYRRVLSVALSMVDALPFLDEVGELVMLHGTEDQTDVLRALMERILTIQVVGDGPTDL